MFMLMLMLCAQPMDAALGGAAHTHAHTHTRGAGPHAQPPTLAGINSMLQRTGLERIADGAGDGAGASHSDSMTVSTPSE